MTDNRTEAQYLHFVHTIYQIKWRNWWPVTQALEYVIAEYLRFLVKNKISLTKEIFCSTLDAHPLIEAYFQHTFFGR